MTVRRAGGLGLIAWLASPVALLAIGWVAGLRLNLTGSLPAGLYVTEVGSRIEPSAVLTTW